MVSMKSLMMMSVIHAPPCRLVSPFSKLKLATAIMTRQHATAQGRIVNTAAIAAFFCTPPEERVISTFRGHHFTAAYRTFIIPCIICAD
jgi:hypothetical protein